MFVWTEQFETKIEVIDFQHKNLFDLINKVSENLTLGTSNFDLLNGSIKILIHYTKSHFHDEELLMAEGRADPRHIASHRMEHKSFIYDVERMSNIMSSEENINDKVERLVRFTTSWLMFHILGTDMFLAAQLANIKSGMDARRAFEMGRERRFDFPTVKTMLDASISMWLDAKERCAQLDIKCKELEEKVESLEIELQFAKLRR